MKFLPICLNIENKKILMIGGGKVAAHKALILNKFVEKITILAPEIDPVLNPNEFILIRKEYEKNDLDGYDLLYVCTDNRELNQQIKKDAESIHLLANVCDAPSDCDFVSPAICQIENISIAVSSDGKEVKRSVSVRNQILDLINKGVIKIN